VTVGNAPAASPLPGECGRRRQGGSPPSEGEHFSVNADERSCLLSACAVGCRLNCGFLLSCPGRCRATASRSLRVCSAATPVASAIPSTWQRPITLGTVGNMRAQPPPIMPSLPAGPGVIALREVDGMAPYRPPLLPSPLRRSGYPGDLPARRGRSSVLNSRGAVAGLRNC